MEQKEPLVNINNFSWWISQSATVPSPTNSYAYSNCINIFETSFWLAPEVNTIWTTNWMPTCQMFKTPFMYAFTDTGFVYRRWNGVALSKCYEMNSSDNEICNNIVVGTNLFMITRSHISKIAYNLIDADWTWDVWEDYREVTSNYMHPVYNDHDSFLYIWSWYKLDMLEISWMVMTKAKLTFNYYEFIVAITKIWEYVRIYTYNTVTRSSKVYLWDWSSDNTISDAGFENIQIQNVVNKWNFDYAISDTSIYYCSGLSYQEVYFSWKDYKQNKIINQDFDNSVLSYTNVASYKTNMFLAWTYGIFMYGHIIPGYPDSFRQLTWAINDQVTTIFHTWWEYIYTSGSNYMNLFWAQGNSWTYTICWLWYTMNWTAKENLATQGERHSLIYDWWIYGDIKKIDRIKIWYNLDNWATIYIYIKRNWWNLELLKTITDYTSKQAVIFGKDTQYNTFNSCQFIIIMSKWVTNGKSTRIYNLELYLELINPK